LSDRGRTQRGSNGEHRKELRHVKSSRNCWDA
jgi:hypothetical protein